MNRRQALKTMFAASVAMFIEPVPRRRIDLKSFCSPTEGAKWDLRLPYVLTDWTYATNAKICVRVRPESGDVAKHTGKVPPFSSLQWADGRTERGWKTLPKRDPLMATDSYCPACDGNGYAGGVIATDCDRCEGTGTEWWNNERRNGSCLKCRGKGHYAPAEVCPMCKGDAFGTFPSLVELNGQFFNTGLYDKAQSLGCEYLLGDMSDNYFVTYPLIKFRFDGGDGLLLGLEQGSARKVIAEARS